MASRMRQRWDFLLLTGLRLLARPLPWPWLLAVGRGLGSFVWHTRLYRRHVVLDNLRGAFGGEMDEAALERLARAFYRNLGMTLMEFLAFDRLDKAGICARVAVDNLEHYRAVVDAGRGGLLVSGHFGNWELLGARVAALGSRVNFIVKTQSNPDVDRVQNAIRERAGLGIIRAGASIKEMIRALRRQELIGMVADQDAGADGHFVEFMGRPASVFKGTAYFAWKLQVPVLTGFIYRQPDGTHRVEIDEPFAADPAWDEATAVDRLTRMYIERLERAVRRAPEQYFWVHRRWKTRPPQDDAGQDDAKQDDAEQDDARPDEAPRGQDGEA